jgi:(2R)-3-sulfolactate dehydrogenase (NADP+)
MAIYTFDQAVDRATQVLEAAGANRAMALSTAKGLVMAEAQGLTSHGLSRLKQYASHLSVGRVNPLAQPSIVKDSRAPDLGALLPWELQCSALIGQTFC